MKKYTLTKLKTVFVLLSVAVNVNLSGLNFNVITIKGQPESKLKKINVSLIDGNDSVNEVGKGE